MKNEPRKTLKLSGNMKIIPFEQPPTDESVSEPVAPPSESMMPQNDYVVFWSKGPADNPTDGEKVVKAENASLAAAQVGIDLGDMYAIDAVVRSDLMDSLVRSEDGSDDADTEIGYRIINLLYLSALPSTEQVSSAVRYPTAIGNKTPMGLTRTLRRILNGEKLT